MKYKSGKLKATFLFLISILIFNPAKAQTNTFIPVNGMTIGPNYIVFEAEATESPLGKWQIIKPGDARYKNSSSVAPINNTHLEFTGNDYNSGPATSPLEYRFECPKTGTYRLGGRLYQRLEGQPEDKCNDVYIRMAGNFTSANSIPTSVLKTNQKFFGRGVDKWGALYSIDTHDYGQAPVLYNLTEGEIYTFTVSGRAQRTNVDYWILYDNSISYTLGAHKDIAALNDKKYLPQVVQQPWTIQHPVIWATEDEKPEILEKIENYGWAKSIVTKLHTTVDSKVNAHLTNPATILNTIPAIPADDNLTEAQATNTGNHTKILTYASYAGMLYYLTGEEKYAQFAADILSYYIDELAPRSPETTTISGNSFYDPRSTYGHFAIAYDFVFNFLKAAETKVYQKSSGTMVAFDNIKAQKVVHNIAVNALQEFDGADTHGRTISNHPVLRAPGVLFSILNVEDDTERERLFNVFWEKGTKEQNSFKHTILPMFGEQGIWPEAVSYSFMPNITLVLNVVDRIKPEMNVTATHLNILEGNFLFDNLRLPDRRFVRYGDSHRDNDGTGALYRYTLNLSTRRGYTEYAHKAKVALRQSYDAEGGYNPEVAVSTFDNYGGFEQLLWGVDVPETVEGKIDFQKPTVIIKHAGVALQRNYVEKDNRDYGLCGIIGGAHYVHSHCTGITMELYGAGYVMAANAGLPKTLAQRKEPEHTNYFWRHAGNNTMIVNGTTHGSQTGAWNSDSYLWQNTTVNVAAEPKHLEDPVNPNFSFATQFLDDKVNNDQQQRTLSTIRTSETTGYYFDMFRSKSLSTNNFHDYIYHNLGDATNILTMDGTNLSVSPTSRYQNDIGDSRQSPGWRFFEQTNVTEPTDEAIHIRFDLIETNTTMNMFAPAGVAREYTKALGPATREARGGYINKKTQIVAIRQQGEAWNRPYVHIFEPSKSTNASVKSVEHLYDDDAIIGAKVSSEIGDKTVEDYILCLPDSESSVTLSNGISFSGRFAVVRYEQDLEKALTTLYVGEGDSLSFGDLILKTDADRKGVLVAEGEPYFGRQLQFKNIHHKDVVPKGTNLGIEAIVGEEYTAVTLWANDTINLGTKTKAPYIWSGHAVISNMQAEEYTFTLDAKDAQGQTVKKTIVIETPGQKPYPDREVPHPVPGKIEFEDYDSGGKGLGFFDNTGQDFSLYSYRDSTETVDLGRNGTVVSSVEAGEWLEYTVDVQQSGFYKLSVRHRTTMAPSVQAFSVLLPNLGDTLLSNVQTLYTGRSDFYVDAMGEFFLKSGKQVIRFAIIGSGFDLDYMQLELTKTTNTKDLTQELKGFKVFPNPASDNVTIVTEGFNAAGIAIFNLAGQVIYSVSAPDEYTRLSLDSKYKTGVYIVRVLDENRKAYYKKLVFGLK
jgi:hypothetical protein